MGIISSTVIDAVSNVLEKQFNIQIKQDKATGEFSFRDLKSDKDFIAKRIIKIFPNHGNRREEENYETPSGRELYLNKQVFDSGLGEIDIVFEEDGHVWRIHGDNHQRAKKVISSRAPLDVAHVALYYYGKKIYKDLSLDNDGPIEMVTRVEIYPYDYVCEKVSDMDHLATFYYLGHPIINLTFEGIYSKDNIELDTCKYGYKVSNSFAPAAIETALESVNYDYLCIQTIPSEVRRKALQFMIGRIEELKEYITKHQSEYLERLDRVADSSAPSVSSEKKKEFIKAYQKGDI